MSQGAFVATSRFKTAIALINDAELGKLEKIASTIIARLGDVNLQQTQGGTFTESEKEQLIAMLSLSADDLDTLVSGCSYVWDQAAFFNLSGDKLAAQLTEQGASEEAAAALANVWRANGQGLIARLRERTLGAPLVLRDVDWRLQMTMGHADLGRTKVPNAILDLTLGDVEGDMDGVTEQQHVRLELSRDELTRLFQDLEKVQSQLDQLTK